MLSFTFATFTVLLASGYGAPSNCTLDVRNSYGNGTSIFCRGCDGAPFKGSIAYIVVLSVLFGICLFGCICMCCCCVVHEREEKRARTPCKVYTTAPNATADKVYKQLRNKWKTHQSRLGFVLGDEGLIAVMRSMRSAERQHTTNMITEAKHYNEQLKVCFAADKYTPPSPSVTFSQNSVNIENPQTTVDIPLLFKKECILIEALSYRVSELRRLIPEPERRESRGMSPFIIGGAAGGAAAACAAGAC